MSKKLLIWICAMVLVAASLAGIVIAFSGSGDGSAGNPYNITSCPQLNETRLKLKANYILGNDIDCSVTKTWNGGKGFAPIGTFSGVFNGTNHKIMNLMINRSADSFIGLFSLVNGAKIYNLGLVNVSVRGASITGGVAGYFSNSTMNNVYLSGNVSGGDTVGGLIGELFASGYNRVDNSYSRGMVQGSDYSVGGLIGVIGGTSPIIVNCYSSANVSAPIGNVGGLIGECSSGYVNNSYSIGHVSGPISTNGFIGSCNCAVTSSVWNSQTSGQSSSGCSSGVSGKTTAQMKMKSTYTALNWNVSSVWDVRPDANSGYPLLRSLIPSGAYGIVPTTRVIVLMPIISGMILKDSFGDVLNTSTVFFGGTLFFEDLFGNKIIEFSANSSVDLSGVSVGKTASTAFVSNIQNVAGVNGTHSLYLPTIADRGVYVCPNATSLVQINPRCSNKFTLGVGSSYGGVSLSIESGMYKISGLTGTGAAVNGTPGVIPMESAWNVSIDPFYTTENNPKSRLDNSCLGNMKAGDSCTVSWNVVPTWNETDKWAFFSIFNSTYSLVNVTYSPIINLTITPQLDVLTITRPSSGAVISNFSLVEAVSNAQLRKVVFYVTNSTGAGYSLSGALGSATTDSNNSDGWNAVWDTNVFPDGIYNLTAKAYRTCYLLFSCLVATDTNTNIRIDNKLLTDITPPAASIFINNNDSFTNSRSVFLNLSFSDNVGVDKCRFKNEVGAWTVYEPCTSVRAWQLSSGYGNKTVFFEVKDLSGNTVVANDTIAYSAALPGAPTAGLLECLVGLNWSSCANLGYGDTLSRVRIGCTSPNEIKVVSFELYNSQHETTLFSSAFTSKDSNYYYYDYNLKMMFSGNFTLTARCVDAVNNALNFTTNWFVPFGSIVTTVLTPNLLVNRFDIFDYKVRFSCVGGECGDVRAVLDPQVARK